MRQHGCQFVFGFQVQQQPAVDIDKTTGQCKGVDLRTVDNGKGVFQITAVTACGDALAHFIDIAIDLLVFHHAHAGQHFLMFFVTDFQFP